MQGHFAFTPIIGIRSDERIVFFGGEHPFLQIRSDEFDRCVFYIRRIQIVSESIVHPDDAPVTQGKSER